MRRRISGTSIGQILVSGIHEQFTFAYMGIGFKRLSGRSKMDAKYGM